MSSCSSPPSGEELRHRFGRWPFPFSIKAARSLFPTGRRRRTSFVGEGSRTNSEQGVRRFRVADCLASGALFWYCPN